MKKTTNYVAKCKVCSWKGEIKTREAFSMQQARFHVRKTGHTTVVSPVKLERTEEINLSKVELSQLLSYIEHIIDVTVNSFINIDDTKDDINDEFIGDGDIVPMKKALVEEVSDFLKQSMKLIKIEKKYGLDFGEQNSNKDLVQYLKEQGYDGLAKLLSRKPKNEIPNKNKR